jgi:hypothetical protein
MRVNPDFRELFAELNAAQAEYLVVGAHALAAHGHVRATKDLDVWIRCNTENAARVHAALGAFGAPLARLSVEDLAADPGRASGPAALRCRTARGGSGLATASSPAIVPGHRLHKLRRDQG